MKKILSIIFAMSLALTFTVQPANAQAAKAITKLVKSASKVKPKVKPTPVQSTKVRPSSTLKSSSGGSRKLNGADDAVRLIPCTTCNGSGYVYYNYNRYTCTSCRGTGKLVSRR